MTGKEQRPTDQLTNPVCARVTNTVVKNKKGAKARKLIQQMRSTNMGVQHTEAYQKKMASERRKAKAAEAQARAGEYSRV